jgi:phosphoglycolate phosphatase
LFDLDGTLTDPGVGITNSVRYALRQFGIEVGDRSELYPFIGPPLQESFERYFGFSSADAKAAIVHYRDYFRTEGMFENVVYPGVEPLLASLKTLGKVLLVATSKPEVFAQQILDHFGLARHFAAITGSRLDGTQVHKDEVIRCALERCAVAERNKAIMIGDREHDVIGARKAGIDCLGVLYGYGTRAELERAGADVLVETVEAIGTYLTAP